MDILSAATAFGAAATMFLVVIAIAIFAPGFAVEIVVRKEDQR
jgi:hypothetical protein